MKKILATVLGIGFLFVVAGFLTFSWVIFSFKY